jgi:hypothetical protein
MHHCLEELTGYQLVKKFPVFHGTRSFVTGIAIACHYPEVNNFSPCLFFSLPEGTFLNYQAVYSWVFQIVTYVQVSPPKILYGYPLSSIVLHAPLISFLSI